jgi:integrase/recombinase XerD
LLIEDFRQDVLEGGAKPVTANRYLERVRAFFNQAVAWRLAEANPFTGVKMLKVHQREPRFLSDDEIARLLAVLDGDLRDVVIVALQTGCRETEIVRIELAHCRDDGIHLPKTKSYRPRTIPYAPLVAEIVSRRKGNQSPPMIYLFDNGRGQPLQGASTWYYWLRLAYARAGIIGANFHTLRHTFATRLVRAGVNMRVVQDLMGHQHISTTLRYVHLYDDDRERAVERLVLPEMKTGAGCPTPVADHGALESG